MFNLHIILYETHYHTVCTGNGTIEFDEFCYMILCIKGKGRSLSRVWRYLKTFLSQLQFYRSPLAMNHTVAQPPSDDDNNNNANKSSLNNNHMNRIYNQNGSSNGNGGPDSSDMSSEDCEDINNQNNNNNNNNMTGIRRSSYQKNKYNNNNVKRNSYISTIEKKHNNNNHEEEMEQQLLEEERLKHNHNTNSNYNSNPHNHNNFDFLNRRSSHDSTSNKTNYNMSVRNNNTNLIAESATDHQLYVENDSNHNHIKKKIKFKNQFRVSSILPRFIFRASQLIKFPISANGNHHTSSPTIGNIRSVQVIPVNEIPNTSASSPSRSVEKRPVENQMFNPAREDNIHSKFCLCGCRGKNL